MSWPEEMHPAPRPHDCLEAIGSHLVAMFGAALFNRLRPRADFDTLDRIDAIIALATSASSRSNTGSPQPGDKPLAMTVTRAPMESPASRIR